jgi:hypothetical protein
MPRKLLESKTQKVRNLEHYNSGKFVVYTGYLLARWRCEIQDAESGRASSYETPLYLRGIESR